MYPYVQQNKHLKCLLSSRIKYRIIAAESAIACGLEHYEMKIPHTTVIALLYLLTSGFGFVMSWIFIIFSSMTHRKNIRGSSWFIQTHSCPYSSHCNWHSKWYLFSSVWSSSRWWLGNITDVWWVQGFLVQRLWTQQHIITTLQLGVGCKAVWLLWNETLSLFIPGFIHCFFEFI